MSNSESAKPRLAVLTPRFPLPLNKGDRLRIHHQLRELHRHFEVDLHCLTFRKVTPAEQEAIKDRCDSLTLYPLNRFKALGRMAWAVLSRRPFQVLLFTERKHVRSLRRNLLASPPDALLAQMVRTAEYVKDFDHVPHVLDIMDTLHAGAEREAEKAPRWKRGLLREEGRRLLRYEHRVHHYFDACTIISEQDRNLLPHPDRDQVIIVPNGVDLDHFDPNAKAQSLPPLPPGWTPDVAFCGNLGYAPNIVAAKHLAEQVAPCFEAMHGLPLKVLICGAQPAAAVRQLQSPNIQVVADVSDIRAAYLAAPLFVAPMLVNTGLQNKLLEAMALERVCITTPRAVAALGIPTGKTVITAESPEEFAAAIFDGLKHVSRREAMGKEARQLVEAHFHWRSTTATLVTLLMNLSAGR